MKRLISLAAVIAILLSAVCFGVSAEAETAYDVLFEGISEFSENIDISAFGFDSDELGACMDDLMHNEPMLFHCSGAFSYYYDLHTGMVTKVVPEYTMTESEYREACAFVNAEIEKILDCIPQGLDDSLKALYLHDYLLVSFEYDLDYSIYDIYNMLKSGKSVCMGYALLYDELLTRIGIESCAVLSPATSLNHMWNEIKINGEWYHVDITWDDPVSDVFGRACHQNFLTCDSCTTQNHDNCVFITENVCDSTDYEKVGWRWIDSPFAFVGDTVYALDNDKLVEFDIYDSELTTVETLLDKGWYATDGRYLGYCSGFGGYGEMLYYNTPDSIICYNPQNGVSAPVFTPEEGIIVGMYLNGNELHYLLSSTGYNEHGVEYTLTVSGVPEQDESTPDESTPDESTPDESVSDESVPDESVPDESTPDESVPDESTPEYEPGVGGDANGDGKLDQYDYIYVKRIYFGTITVSDADRVRADVNNDSIINTYDYILVKRAYFGTYSFV